MKLLIVDDDRAALYALRHILKDEFCLILLDVRLPKMDGFEVAAAIRSLERMRRTPIIFMSANEDRRRSQRDGAPEHYFRKPLAPELVRSTVMSLLPPLVPSTGFQEATHEQQR